MLHLIAMQIFNFNKERMLKVHKEHEELITIISKKNVEEAVKLITYHIDDSEKEALRAFFARE
jgi:DNA-binding GntR family transcriptional regulator